MRGSPSWRWRSFPPWTTEGGCAHRAARAERRDPGDAIGSLLDTLAALPPLVVYLVIGVGAAVENVIPPVPADTFVLIGAFLAAAGRASPWIVFLVTWLCNVASALGVYTVARHFGPTFFDTRAGRTILNQRQMDQIGGFYDRWGTAAVFGSRFLPAFRAMVPVFAGVTGVQFWRVAIPLAFASGLWYGALVYLGAAAGRNWEAITATFQQASTMLLTIATVLVVAFIAWWWRSRRPSG